MSESTAAPLLNALPVRSSLAALPAGRRLAALFALASVWLTTAGHTASFREMNGARGWVTTDGYALHSSYLFAIAGGLALTWANRPLLRPERVVRWGLSFLVVGSFVNGLLLQAPYSFLILSRMIAGFGAGMVLASAPVAGQAAGSRWFTWAGILLPSVGPLIIALAADFHREQGWEGSFLFEGLLSAGALIAVILQGEDETKRKVGGEANDPIRGGWPIIPLWFPLFAIFLLCLWYAITFGQLRGWGEDPRCALAMVLGAVSLALLFATQILSAQSFRALPPRTWPTLALAAYAGFVQFFNVSDMGVYGGLLLDLGKFDRSLLIWPLSLGAAAGTILALFLPRTRGLALIGLISITLGMGLAHGRTMGWTYWSLLNTVQFNWFAAPGVWELARARFLMGLGTSLTLIGLQRFALPQTAQEGLRRDMLTLFQFLGGGVSIGVLTLCVTRLYQAEYAYAAERGSIQTEAYGEYGQIVDGYLHGQGFTQSEAATRAILHNGVIYESNNLVFATIYGTFFTSALIAIGLLLFWWVWHLTVQAARQPALENR